MNTTEIDRFVRGDNACRGIFQGVFSADTLPEKPRLLVGNTDPSDKPGNHWIAVFVDSTGRGEYFDSFGRKPFGIFERYMNKHCVEWIFGTRQLQSIASSYCGFYCCFYCMLRCRGFDLTRIVNLFTRDTGFNDSIVRGFVCDDGEGIPPENSRFPQIQFLRSKHQIEPSAESRPHAEKLVVAHQSSRRDLHATRHRVSKRGRGARYEMLGGRNDVARIKRTE